MARRGAPYARNGGGGDEADPTQVFVGNISFDTDWRSLKDHMSQAGEVVRFGDFLRALPKAYEQNDEEFDEEEFEDPKQAVV